MLSIKLQFLFYFSEYRTDHFIEIADLFLSGTVSRATALLLLEEMVSGNKDSPTKVNRFRPIE